MKKSADFYVNMEHVIGHLAIQYGVPIMSFDNLTILGQRAIQVYGLQEQGKKIEFEALCEVIRAYIATPFGRAALKELVQ